MGRSMSDRRYGVGVDLSDGESLTVVGYWEEGVFHLISVGRVGSDTVIEGEFVEVERRSERLLDAGGSEP